MIWLKFNLFEHPNEQHIFSCVGKTIPGILSKHHTLLLAMLYFKVKNPFCGGDGVVRNSNFEGKVN